MFTKIYAAFGGLLLCGYLAATLTGWEIASPEQKRLPSGQEPSIRQSPGGYRSFHFWHSGFHGGK